MEKKNDIFRIEEINRNNSKMTPYFNINKQGKRQYNEDRALILQSQDFQVYAVFDGHGGDQTSDYLKNYFYLAFKSIMNDKNKSAQFIQLDKDKVLKYIQNHIDKVQENIKKDQKFQKSGSTMNMVLIMKDKIYTFNIGDSRTIAYQTDFLPAQLTSDHKTYNIFEYQQLEEKKIKVQGERVQGILSMTRAIGDVELHLNRFVDMRIYDRDKYYAITLASDGLYDVVDQEDFFQKFFYYLYINKNQNPLQQIYDDYSKEFDDNVTIISVILKQK